MARLSRKTSLKSHFPNESPRETNSQHFKSITTLQAQCTPNPNVAGQSSLRDNLDLGEKDNYFAGIVQAEENRKLEEESQELSQNNMRCDGDMERLVLKVSTGDEQSIVKVSTGDEQSIVKVSTGDEQSIVKRESVSEDQLQGDGCYIFKVPEIPRWKKKGCKRRERAEGLRNSAAAHTFCEELSQLQRELIKLRKASLRLPITSISVNTVASENKISVLHKYENNFCVPSIIPRNYFTVTTMTLVKISAEISVTLKKLTNVLILDTRNKLQSPSIKMTQNLSFRILETISDRGFSSSPFLEDVARAKTVHSHTAVTSCEEARKAEAHSSIVSSSAKNDAGGGSGDAGEAKLDILQQDEHPLTSAMCSEVTLGLCTGKKKAELMLYEWSHVLPVVKKSKMDHFQERGFYDIILNSDKNAQNLPGNKSPVSKKGISLDGIVNQSEESDRLHYESCSFSANMTNKCSGIIELMNKNLIPEYVQRRKTVPNGEILYEDLGESHHSLKVSCMREIPTENINSGQAFGNGEKTMFSNTPTNIGMENCLSNIPLTVLNLCSKNNSVDVESGMCYHSESCKRTKCRQKYNKKIKRKKVCDVTDEEKNIRCLKSKAETYSERTQVMLAQRNKSRTTGNNSASNTKFLPRNKAGVPKGTMLTQALTNNNHRIITPATDREPVTFSVSYIDHVNGNDGRELERTDTSTKAYTSVTAYVTQHHTSSRNSPEAVKTRRKSPRNHESDVLQREIMVAETVKSYPYPMLLPLTQPGLNYTCSTSCSSSSILPEAYSSQSPSRGDRSGMSHGSSSSGMSLSVNVATGAGTPVGLGAGGLMGSSPSPRIKDSIFAQRKQREFIPDNKKDESYWDRRRRNNEAAKRSREKRRFNDMILEQRVLELSKENYLLRAQVTAFESKFNIKGEGLVNEEQVLASMPQADQILALTRRPNVSLLSMASPTSLQPSSPPSHSSSALHDDDQYSMTQYTSQHQSLDRAASPHGSTRSQSPGYYPRDPHSVQLSYSPESTSYHESTALNLSSRSSRSPPNMEYCDDQAIRSIDYSGSCLPHKLRHKTHQQQQSCNTGSSVLSTHPHSGQQIMRPRSTSPMRGQFPQTLPHHYQQSPSPVRQVYHQSHLRSSSPSTSPSSSTHLLYPIKSEPIPREVGEESPGSSDDRDSGVSLTSSPPLGGDSSVLAFQSSYPSRDPSECMDWDREQPIRALISKLYTEVRDLKSKVNQEKHGEPRR